MFFEYMAMSDAVIVVASFSLAWLLVGVLVGKNLTSQKGRRRGASRKRSSGSSSGCEIYVGNLSYNINENDLKKIFSKYGKTLSARIITNKFNGKSKGFGFVEMSSNSEMNDAVAALDGKNIKGRKIVCNEAKSRSRD